MREIIGKLTDELKQYTSPDNIAKDEGYPVKNFRELVEHTAKLAYKNKDLILFYRGQKNDYKNKVGKSTFYPTIYRGDYLRKDVLNDKFRLLKKAFELLVNEFKSNKTIGRTELERKKYIGKTFGEDKVKLLQNSDTFVLPSYYKSEAFPISIIEAMACKNAIVTTNYKYLPDVINEQNGVLVEPKCVDSLADGIESLIVDKERLKKIQAYNKKEAKDNYSLDRHIERLKNIVT